MGNLNAGNFLEGGYDPFSTDDIGEVASQKVQRAEFSTFLARPEVKGIGAGEI